MTTTAPLPFARDDTMLGVCEALGHDFGVPPLALRLALAPLLMWQPVAVIVGYLALGVVVNLAHWLLPTRVAAPAAPAAAPAPAPAQDLDAVDYAEAA